jgi:hypothetical protein
MIANAVLLFKFLLKLWPFVREVFFKNKDFRDAIVSNKSIVTLLCSSLVLLLLTVGNAKSSHEYARLYDRVLRESRETTTKYQSLITDHADLVGKYEALRDEHHNQEIDHAAVKAEKIWMEKRVADLEVSLEFERTRGNKHK